MYEFANKIALVTGGSQGLGRGITLELAKRQATVVVNYVGKDEMAEKTMQELQCLGASAIKIKADVSNPKEVDRLFRQIKSEYGRLDILINNAGITRDRTLLKMSKQEWADVIEVNLTGVFNCTQAVASVMKNQNYGRIVSASSTVAIRGSFGQTNYVATKSAVIGMTKVWAMELGKYGITVNCC